MGKKAITKLVPVLGFLFLTAYIRSATVDVVYTDYIRLINSYLPDVFSLQPYLHGDILTRTPVCYLERILNVVLFHYSTTFDMILGAAGLAFCAVVIGNYLSRCKTGAGTILFALFLVFSLDKWEMLTNGTGWVYFWAMGLFFYHYLVLDRVRSGEEKKGDRIRLLILPPVIICLFAGPYCAIYFAALTVIYLIDLVTAEQKETYAKTHWKEWLALLIPFVLFLISRACSVEEHAGATDAGFLQTVVTQPLLILSMILKSFAGPLIGGETATALGLPDPVLWALGLLMLAAYIFAVAENIRSGLYRKTVFPLLLIVSGLASHGVVFLARWIFLDDMYLMSSRYSLQYMSGTIGILLTFAMTRKRAFHSVVLAVLLAGQILTTGREIHMAPYRQEAFVHMREAAWNFETESDETLKQTLQYHAPEKTRAALTILKEKEWNIWTGHTD